MLRRRDMVERSEISTCKTPVELVDAAAFVTEWWENAEGRRLLGEKGGYTVFRRRVLGWLSFSSITPREACLSAFRNWGLGPVEVWRNNFLSEHMGQMAYVVRCEFSDLAVADALELVTRLVVAAPGGMELRGRGVLEHPECFLGEHALEPVTMSFGEWVKTRETAENGGSLSSNIP